MLDPRRLLRSRRIGSLAVFTFVLFCDPIRAQTTGGLQLAQVNNCVSCHQMDRKVVGPAFNAISERFSGSPEAVDYLVNSIREGSRGKWGPVPMPKQVQVSPQDARELARWILSLDDTPSLEPELLENENE